MCGSANSLPPNKATLPTTAATRDWVVGAELGTTILGGWVVAMAADEGTLDGDTIGMGDMIGAVAGATGDSVGTTGEAVGETTVGANEAGGRGANVGATKAAVGKIVGEADGSSVVGARLGVMTGDAVVGVGGTSTGTGALVDRTGRALGKTAGVATVGKMGAIVFLITGAAGVNGQVGGGGTVGALVVGDKVGTIAAYFPQRRASCKAKFIRSISRWSDRSNLRSSISCAISDSDRIFRRHS